MRKHFPFLLTAASVFLLFNSCNDKNVNSAKVALGLAKADPEKIARIPRAEIPFGGTELPESVDMSDKMPEAGSQGIQQSCVAWAIAYALKSYQENVQIGATLKFSPSYVYNQINGGRNVPTQLPDALNILSEQGVCLMDEMPYNENDWEDQPSTEAKNSAKRFRIDEWRRVNTMDVKEVKSYLAAGSPIIIGANVTAEFQKKGFEGEEFVWKKNGESIGGHAMLVVGYDNDKSAFKIINSWGKNWGGNGCVWIDYELFKDVVMFGFVTKDGFTDKEVANDVKKGVEPEENPTKNDEPIYVKNDNPTKEDEGVDIKKTNVVYNVENPDKEHPGQSMRIEGTLDIPPRYGKSMYVLVTVYNKATDKPVKTKIYPDYSNIYNEVAGYTQEYELDEERYKAKWWLHIPYSALDLPPGKHDLYAIPTLFIDKFGVKNGERIDFWFQQPE